MTIGATVIFLDNRSTVTRPVLPDMILRRRRHFAKAPAHPELYYQPNSKERRCTIELQSWMAGGRTWTEHHAVVSVIRLRADAELAEQAFKVAG